VGLPECSTHEDGDGVSLISDVGVRLRARSGILFGGSLGGIGESVVVGRLSEQDPFCGMGTYRPVGSVDQPYAYTIDTTVADGERADGGELREAGVRSAVLGKADTGTGR
jgi:hypothetical protein